MKVGVERFSTYGQSDICVQGHSKFPLGWAGEPPSVQLEAPAWEVLFGEPGSASHTSPGSAAPWPLGTSPAPAGALEQVGLGNHAAEDQWLMNIPGKTHPVGSICLQG